MPFDNPPAPDYSRVFTREDTEELRILLAPPKPDRWNRHLKGPPVVHHFDLLPLSDTTILMAMRDILRNAPEKWLRGNVGCRTEACAVGWLYNFCEPSNVIGKPQEQTVRLLRRLYWALPRYARGNGKDIGGRIGAYNDKSSNATLDRWLTRAINAAC